VEGYVRCSPGWQDSCLSSALLCAARRSSAACRSSRSRLPYFRLRSTSRSRSDCCYPPVASLRWAHAIDSAASARAVERLVVERASAAADRTVCFERSPARLTDRVDDRRGVIDQPTADVDADSGVRLVEQKPVRGESYGVVSVRLLRGGNRVGDAAEPRDIVVEPRQLSCDDGLRRTVLLRRRLRSQGERRLAPSTVAAGHKDSRCTRYEEHLQNGIASTACFARSISGWTAKNEPTVTTRHATTEPCNRLSLGGEPPIGANCRSSVLRMNIARTTPR
jgi:hypothetical protein